nr:uncharacterized protein LOC129276029 [Lytechinus pictus]
MEELKEVTFERCLTPKEAVGKPLLCIFSDASMHAFGACAYLRWEMDGGGYMTRFVAAKSRVAPLRPLTVPRLELQAAVLASRLYKTILEELRIEIEDVILMTDSTIALSWIRGRAKTFKTFVATSGRNLDQYRPQQMETHLWRKQHSRCVIKRTEGKSELVGSWQQGQTFFKVSI